MKYQQLTEGDRYMIVALKRQGLSVINIAKAIGNIEAPYIVNSDAIPAGIKMALIDQ